MKNIIEKIKYRGFYYYAREFSWLLFNLQFKLLFKKITRFNRPLGVYKAPLLHIKNSKFNIIPLHKHVLLKQKPKKKCSKSIGIHLHLYYEDLSHEILDRLKNLTYPFDLFVSTPNLFNHDQLKLSLRKKLPNVQRIKIKTPPNRGMDLGPLILSFGKDLLQYDLIGHFHTKKSTHLSHGNQWYLYLVNSLLGPKKDNAFYLNSLINFICKKNALCYPAYFLTYTNSKDGWEDNKVMTKTLLKRYTKIKIEEYPVIEYVQGSMFWCQSHHIKAFLRLPVTFQSFPNKPHKNNSLEHLLERLILIYASQSKAKLYKIFN